MEERKLLVTLKDIQRYRILKDVVEKKLKGSDAARILNLSYVHVSRLKAKLLEQGFEGLLRRTPSSSPNKKVTEEIRKEIVRLRKELYYDFNVMHFRDKLEEVHNMSYCYETIRQILITANEHHPRKRRIIHRQRRRMPKAGMLIQMDSSQHNWVSQIEEKWWLIAMIDDATNEVPYVGFFPKDTAFANMQVIRRFIEMKGIFMSLYVDKASHFKTTRHGGLHYNVAYEQEETQIERALNELEISIIPANSPQAKGRIEVTFRLFQDRLIKEMRLAGVKDYDEANRFLQQKFLPWYNQRFAHKDVTSVYMSLPADKNLNLIFCIKKERIVKNDNTVQIYGQIIQIPPSNVKLSFARAKVDVCLLEDHRIFVLYKDKIIAESRLSEENKIVKKERQIEELLNKREYAPLPKLESRSRGTIYRPPKDHPWRRFVYGKGKLPTD